MKAAIIRRYGDATEVEITDTRDPIPGPRQVLVRVRASSLNPLDLKLRAGALRRVMPLRFPAILGFDLAGEIVGTGADVTGWSSGERVYGRTDAQTGGAHAELAVVEGAVLDRIPSGLGFEEAASLPLVSMTALQGLRQVMVKSGDRVLVNGAAGGVGSMAIQIARALGAEVSGACRGDAADLVARLGASVVDYSMGGLEKTSEPFDIIFDAVNSDLTPELDRILGPRGRYVSTGFSPRLLMRKALGRLASRRRFDFIMSKADGVLLREVSAMVTAGRLEPVIDSTYPLSRAADAHARADRGHLRGKVVLTLL